MKINSKVVQEFVSRPGFEALGNYPLYDKVSLAAAIIPPSSTFFTHSIGANGTNITNLLVANQLAHPERFLVTSLNLQILPAAAAGVAVPITMSDLEILLGQTALKFSVNGGNEVLTVPTRMVPAGNGPWHALAAGVTAVNGMPMISLSYPFVYPLESKVTFDIKLLRDGANGTLAAATDVLMILNGIRFRSLQR
jgi:hypothetical protein